MSCAPPVARTDAGGAIGREALDAGAVASGARIKAGARPQGLDCQWGGERRRIKLDPARRATHTRFLAVN
jgi:hypothetical protein